jgi:arylsulfatase A-like enzyme
MSRFSPGHIRAIGYARAQAPLHARGLDDRPCGNGAEQTREGCVEPVNKSPMEFTVRRGSRPRVAHRCGPDRRRRSAAVLALLGCTLFALLSPAHGAESAARPNIIFILADDLGYGEIGCYGQQLIQTPHLDRMAREGMRFTQFYAGAPVCAPSRSVLMTGQHHGHTRVRGNAGRANPQAQMLRPEDVTVAEVLKQAGYRTALIGKWGLGLPGDDGVPNKQGFDYFFGYLSQHHAHNHFPDYLWRNEERVPLPNKVTPVGEDGGGYATEAKVYADDLFRDEALKFISDDSRTAPFFLYLSYVIPHANNERTKALKDGAEVPDYGPYADKNEWATPDKGHAAMITRLDSYVGQLLARLHELGLEERTVVFFASDNGPHKESNHHPAMFKASGPFRGIKRDLTEGGIRVPFIARWPGKIAANTVSKHVGYFGDFFATAAELAHASELPANLDSISFAATLFGEPTQQKQHEFLYWEFHERGFRNAALLDGRWKGIRNAPDAPLELYDLDGDPGESANIAGSHSEIVQKIDEYLKHARTDSPLWPVRPAKSAAQ